MSVSQRTGLAGHTGRAELRCATPLRRAAKNAPVSPGAASGARASPAPETWSRSGSLPTSSRVCRSGRRPPAGRRHTERAAGTAVAQRQHCGTHRGGLETRAAACRAGGRGRRGRARRGRDVRPTRVHRARDAGWAGPRGPCARPGRRPGHLGTASGQAMSTALEKTTAPSSDLASMPIGRRPAGAGSGRRYPLLQPGQDSRSAKISAHSIRHSPQIAPRSRARTRARRGGGQAGAVRPVLAAEAAPFPHLPSGHGTQRPRRNRAVRGQHVTGQRAARRADVHTRPGDERPGLLLGPPAERARRGPPHHAPRAPPAGATGRLDDLVHALVAQPESGRQFASEPPCRCRRRTARWNSARATSASCSASISRSCACRAAASRSSFMLSTVPRHWTRRQGPGRVTTRPGHR